MRFVLIPSGSFTMGSPAGEPQRFDDERLHEVALTRAFYMQTTEVTNGQYRRFHPAHDSGSFRGASLDGDEQPVVKVSWDEAAAFATWLGAQDLGREYRLPTEAQWEYACRSGTRGAFYWGADRQEAHRYANGHDPVTKQEFTFGWDAFPKDDGHRVSAPVGSYLSNAWGLFDMHGNVWEWCADWFDAYPLAAASDPAGPPSGEGRVLRGGSWTHLPSYLRAANRGRFESSVRLDTLGFRLVVPAP
jgi:formylglycine-generating enzyme required for sulfatase activity